MSWRRNWGEGPGCLYLMTPPHPLGPPHFSSPSPAQSLLELHKRRKALTEPEARYYLRQIVLGCQYLHRNRVIHRDLKLGNLFLNEDLEVKIGEVLGLQGGLTPLQEVGMRRRLGEEIGRRQGGRGWWKSGLLIASRIFSLGQTFKTELTSQYLACRCIFCAPTQNFLKRI